MFCIQLWSNTVAHDAVEIEIFDHLRTPIERETFPQIIEQFHRCENFHVVIELNSKGVYTFSSDVRIYITMYGFLQLKYSKPITFQNLRSYLRDHNCTAIIEEEARNNFLSSCSAKILLYRLRDFVELLYSSNPTNDELIEVSQMTIDIFPSMKLENSKIGGIVSRN